MPSTINADNGVSSGSAGLKSAADSSGVLSLQTNGTTAVTVDTSQNVGVGTASPAYKLDVNGVVKNTGAFRSISGSVDGIFGAGQFASGVVGLGSVSNHPLTFNTNLTEYMRIDTSGNVGIGTSSPAQKLDVSGSIKSAGYFIGATGTGGFAALGTTGAVTDGGNFVGRSATSTYNQAGAEIYTGGSERMRIDSSGNLLVGTTIQRVAAKVGIDINPASNAGIVIYPTSNVGYDAARFLNNSSTQIGSIVCTTTGTAYNTSSDYRLKNITGPVTNSGAYIDSLNPVEGTWKADGSTFVGLIAHEVQEVSRTQVATGEKDGAEMQGMDYSSAEIIANLIAEVKSLRARMAQLEAKG